MAGIFDDADVISTYSRAQAIEDGVLVDVSELAREAGFRVPVAITAALHGLLSDIPKGSGEDYTGRLWDVLRMVALAARRAASSDRVHVEVIVNQPGKPRGALVKLWSLIGPGDTWEPVITIMLESED